MISRENGVDVIINKLGRIYRKDEILENYMALEILKTFQRPENMKISDYLNKYGTQISENVLAYRLFRSAKLPELHEQIVKGTITDFNFNLLKEQLKKMFGELLPSIEKNSIKANDTFHAQHTSQNHYKEIYENEFSDDEES